MTDKPYTPSTEDVRRSYVYAESSSFHAIEPSPKDTPFQRECESPVKVARKRDTEEYRAAREEFDQWLDHVHAEAKAEALREAADVFYDNKVIIDNEKYVPCHSCASIAQQYLDYRANQIKEQP